jgi:hypothetical protein
MPKASSFNPLRLFTPIQLIFCLILFFLPWIELQCVVPASELKARPKEQLEKMKKESGWDPTKPFSMYSQSGFQIATGGVSMGSDLRRSTEKMTKDLGGLGAGAKPDASMEAGGKKSEAGSAPLMFLFPLAIIAGIVLGFVLGAGMARRIALLSVCLGAFLLVLLQSLIGFPMERDLKKDAETNMKGMGGMGEMGGMGGGGIGQGAGAKPDTKNEPKMADMFRVSWQFPMYLTLVLLLGAAATSFLDGGSPKARRKAYNFDDDEDDEDDDEDRPRKKKRRDEEDEDDDEDEPPKKKSKKARTLDDDEDEPPTKKRRQQEDEEEEPPRKKRRVEAEDEDEERPQKKRRTREDDEAEEPPPKKRRVEEPPPAEEPRKKNAPAAGENPFDFNGDEPPKKKKPPRDEEHEDDRPRKKKRRDDDD